MKTLVKTKVIRITDVQHNTLEKFRNRKVNVAQFIRDAISEKLRRDAKELILKKNKVFCPF